VNKICKEKTEMMGDTQIYNDGYHNTLRYKISIGSGQVKIADMARCRPKTHKTN